MPLHLFLILLAGPGTVQTPSLTACAVDSYLMVFEPDREYYEALNLKEPITALAAGVDLYVLTNRSLFTLDSAAREIKNRSYVPLQYNSLALLSGRRGQDSMLVALAADEISLVEPNRHNYVNGIGLIPGEHEILLAPLRRAFYLNTRMANGSQIQVFTLPAGRVQRRLKLKTNVIQMLDNGTSTIYLLDTAGWCWRLSPDLRTSRELLRISSAQPRMHLCGEQIAIVTPSEILLLDASSGQLLQSKPHPSEGSLRLSNTELVTWTNPDSVGNPGGLSVIDIATLAPIRYVSLTAKIISLLPRGQRQVVGRTAQGFIAIDLVTGVMHELARHLVEPGPPRPPQLSTDSLYYIQVGAYRDPAKARAAVDTAARKGISAFCDSTTSFTRVRVGGFLNREDAELFGTFYPDKKWIVFAPRYRSAPVKDGSLTAFVSDRSLLIYRHEAGVMHFVRRVDDFYVTYTEPVIARDSLLEVGRTDGRRSIFAVIKGALHETIENIQD